MPSLIRVVSTILVKMEHWEKFWPGPTRPLEEAFPDPAVEADPCHCESFFRKDEAISRPS